MGRLRISIRSLLIFTAAVAIYLGWQLSIVQQRRAELRSLRQLPGAQIVPMDAPSWTEPSANFVRKLLGDEPLKSISYYSTSAVDVQRKERIVRIFPEAEVIEYVPEPCHPGCFPSGTLVQTPNGSRRIEQIVPGDRVGILQDDDLQRDRLWGEVESVFRTQNELWRIETTHGQLVTTSTQPLLVVGQGVLQVRQLRSGMQLVRLDDDGLRAVEVLSIESTGQIEMVHNLILGEGVLFLANQFVAQSKPPKS